MHRWRVVLLVLTWTFCVAGNLVIWMSGPFGLSVGQACWTGLALMGCGLVTAELFYRID